MTMTKINLLIRLLFLLVFLTVQSSYGQSQSAKWLKAVENLEYPEYRLIKKNELKVYSKFDFSQLIRPKTEFLGFIEPNYQRLTVYFNHVSKSSPFVYLIKGATVVKGNRCDFSGSIKLTQIREYSSMHYGVDGEYKNKGIIKHGVAIGTFRFEEDPSQKHVGIFEGVMTVNWYLDRAGRIHYDDLESESDAYRNNQYVSIWTQYGSKKGKTANWGEFRIPFSGDLDIGAGEFSVNPKYIENGWSGFRTP